MKAKLTLIVLILSIALSSCDLGDAIQAVSSLAYDGAKPASRQLLTLSPRITTCGVADTQLLYNAIDADEAAGALEGVSMDAWQDGQMGAFSCVTAE